MCSRSIVEVTLPLSARLAHCQTSTTPVIDKEPKSILSCVKPQAHSVRLHHSATTKWKLAAFWQCNKNPLGTVFSQWQWAVEVEGVNITKTYIAGLTHILSTKSYRLWQYLLFPAPKINIAVFKIYISFFYFMCKYNVIK